MPFKPGQEKIAGRKKGTKNKKTELLVPLLDQLKAQNFDLVAEITNLYPTLMPDSQANLLIKLMEFVFPKKRQITVEEAQETLKHDLISKGIDLNSAVEQLSGNSSEEEAGAEDPTEIPF